MQTEKRFLAEEGIEIVNWKGQDESYRRSKVRAGVRMKRGRRRRVRGRAAETEIIRCLTTSARLSARYFTDDDIVNQRDAGRGSEDAIEIRNRREKRVV